MFAPSAGDRGAVGPPNGPIAQNSVCVGAYSARSLGRVVGLSGCSFIVLFFEGGLVTHGSGDSGWLGCVEATWDRRVGFGSSNSVLLFGQPPLGTCLSTLTDLTAGFLERQSATVNVEVHGFIRRLVSHLLACKNERHLDSSTR